MMGVGIWIHHFFLTGMQLNLYNTTTLINLLLTYVWMGGGMVIRAVQVPEKWWPGKFDIWVFVIIVTTHVAYTLHTRHMSHARHFFCMHVTNHMPVIASLHILSHKIAHAPIPTIRPS